MDDMADKVEAPATAGTDADAPSELELAKAALAKAQQDAQNLRAQFNRNLSLKDQEIQRLQQTTNRTSTPDWGDEDDSSNTVLQATQKLEARLRAAQEREVRRDEELFYLRNPAAEKRKEELAALFNDPTMANELAVMGPDGSVDGLKSLKNAWREIRLRDLEKSEQKSEAAKAGQSSEVERQKKLATISGTGASDSPGAVDISKMSNDEIIKSGLLNDIMDPRDPLRTTDRKNAP